MLLLPAPSDFGGVGPLGVMCGPSAGVFGFLRLLCVLPRPALCRILPAMERITIYESAPGNLPRESPVMAGFSPIRATIASAFFATFTTVSTSTIQGSTSTPLG